MGFSFLLHACVSDTLHAAHTLQKCVIAIAQTFVLCEPNVSHQVSVYRPRGVCMPGQVLHLIQLTSDA